MKQSVFVLVVLLSACGSKDDVVRIGAYSLSVPPGWIRIADPAEPGDVELRKGSMVLSVTVSPRLAGRSPDEPDCRRVPGYPGIELASGRLLELSIGKVCRSTFGGTTDGHHQVTEMMQYSGERDGVIISCDHDDDSSAADCDRIFASLARG